ncbi:MAG: hypothetical protein AB1716_22285, partial [Planctomycetota bacterium]
RGRGALVGRLRGGRGGLGFGWAWRGLGNRRRRIQQRGKYKQAAGWKDTARHSAWSCGVPTEDDRDELSGRLAMASAAVQRAADLSTRML